MAEMIKLQQKLVMIHGTGSGTWDYTGKPRCKPASAGKKYSIILLKKHVFVQIWLHSCMG